MAPSLTIAMRLHQPQSSHGRPVFRAGRQIKGEVTLVVKNAAVELSSVDVLLDGMINLRLEKKYYFIMLTVTRTAKLVMSILDPVPVFRIPGPLYLQPGAYTYPFRLNTEGVFLSTSKEQTLFNNPGSINYWVEAVVLQSSGRRISRKYEVLMQRLERFPSHSLQPLRGCSDTTGCFVSANISMEVSFPDGQFTPGIAKPMKLKVSNYSRSSLAASATLYCNRVCRISDLDLQRNNIKVAKVTPEDGAVIPPMTGSGEYIIDVTVPEYLIPVSTTQPFLSIDFYIKVKLDVRDSVLISNPTVKLPVFIGARQI